MKNRKTISKNKNMILLVASLIIIIAAGLCISGISAYLVAADRAENRTTVGNSEIQINETFRNPDIEAGKTTEITKKVTIENIGKNNSGVRVKAEFSDSRVLAWTELDYNTADWEKSGDFWHYKKPLAPGEETSPLFNRITCVNPTEDQRQDFDVFVYAECRNCEEDDSAAAIRALWS